MKIAFVGKGGSGKSTLTSLFIRYLQGQGRDVLAIDADLNMNLAGLLGVTFPQDRVMASPAVADQIRTHIKGTNPRVQEISKFLPTTPPGSGSNVIARYDDPALDFCSVNVDDATRLLTVGTYDEEGIGQTCYHSHLFVAENLLSHIKADGFDVVCDMVAGTDAFAYSLHLQFDAIILIAEPTPESTEVCSLYLNLAKESGIDGLVHLIGNKIEDEDDLAFILERTGRDPLGCLSYLPALKKARQRGEIINSDVIPSDLMATINHVAHHPVMSEAVRMKKLLSLHEKLNAKEWVKLAYGDVMGQIDPDYMMKEDAA